MRMRKRGNEKVRKCCISAFSHFLILALSYSHILTLHSASLPDGFSSLEGGLPFNGSQWIETGYCPAAGDRFECEVTVADDQPRSTAALFGTVRELESERTFAFYVRQGGDDSSVVTYGDTARGAFFPRGKKVTLSVDPNGATWVWDGGSERLSLTPGFARDGVTPLMIGDANAARFMGDSVPAGTGAAMTLHRFRIWRGGLELVHDYKPYQSPSGEIGLYDALEKDENARFKRLDPQLHPDPQTEKVSEEGNMKVIEFVRNEKKRGSWIITVTGVVEEVEYVLEGASTPAMTDAEEEFFAFGGEDGTVTLESNPSTAPARFYRVKEKER